MCATVQTTIRLAALVVLAVAAQAEAARPPRECRSENGRYSLQIDPGRPGRSGRPCQATLSERADRAGAERTVWQRPLVNDVAPLRALVRNDGRYVVTFDEYQRGGTRHALVIYGAQGELLRHFLLTDLLEKADWSHLQARRHEVTWLDKSRLEFDDAHDQVVIRLAWGHEIRIDLKTLQIVRTRGNGDVTSDIPASVLAILLGHDDGSGGTSPERLPEVAALTPEQQVQADAIAESMREGAQVQEADALALAEAAAAQGPPTATDEVAAQIPAAHPPADEAEAAQVAADSDMLAVPSEFALPPPDPTNKVDYLTWINQFGQVDGPDAAPLYDAAVAQCQAWTGDSDLFQAALRGDPAALQSPELADWLAANGPALAQMRAATQIGARGWSLHSDTGDLVGVTLPNLSALRNLARAGVIEGRTLAEQGLPEDAAGRYFDVLAAGRDTGNGVTLIENLVGIAIQNSAAEALLDLQQDTPADQLDYVQLASEADAAYRPPRPWGDMLVGERATFMDVLQRCWDVDPESGTPTVNRAEVARYLSMVSDDSPADVDAMVGHITELGFERAAQEGMAYYDAVEAVMNLPYAESSAGLTELESIIDRPDANPFFQRFLPALSRCNFVQTRAETTRRATLLVTHLNAYRQQYGQYPDTLNALAGQPYAVDPFSNTPFAYRRAGDSFMLYSVGGNGLDDGGIHDLKGETNDVVFWPRPQ